MTPAALTLRPLIEADEEQAVAAHRELAEEGFEFILGLDDESFAECLARYERERWGTDLPDGRVPATFLGAFVGDVLVGRVSIRHDLNDFLFAIGGHIGYAVRPTHRRRGHATAILRLSLAYARDLGLDRVLITTDDDNLASIAVIERCGGVQDHPVEIGGGEPLKRRYWVPTATDGRGRGANGADEV